MTLTAVGGAIAGTQDETYDGDMTPLPIIWNVNDASWDSETIELRFSGEHERISWTGGYYWFEEEASNYNNQAEYDCSPMGMNLDLDSCMLNDSHVTEFIDSGATGLFGQIVFHVTERMNLTLGYRSTEDEKGAGAVILNSPRVAAQFGTNPLVISADPATNDVTVFRSNSWTSDDYRFVLDYQWNDDLFTYLSWSTAYKAGGFADFINDDTRSAAVLQGRDGVPGTGDEIQPRFGLIPYDPEYVEGYELGLRSEWLDRRLRLNGAIFDMRFTDRHIRSPGQVLPEPALHRQRQSARHQRHRDRSDVRDHGHSEAHFIGRHAGFHVFRHRSVRDRRRIQRKRPANACRTSAPRWDFAIHRTCKTAGSW